MSRPFVFSVESTTDLPYAYWQERGVSVLVYTYTVGGRVYEDRMGRAVPQPTVYDWLDRGERPATSQISAYGYESYFRSLIETYRRPVLHIAFGSGMTPSVNNAVYAAETLARVYPEYPVTVLDSTCSCAGYGLLCDDALDRADAGASPDEVADFVRQNAHKVHHQFFSTDLAVFRRSGRVSGVAATAATILGICPLMHLDHDGRIVAYDKVRGKQKAMTTTVEAVTRLARDRTAYSGKCFIAHSMCEDLARETLRQLRQALPRVKDWRLYPIGDVIAGHCGKGTVAVFFYGDDRA